MCDGNYKILIKKLKKSVEIGNYSCFYGLERLRLLKCPYNSFKASPVKTLVMFSIEPETATVQFLWKHKRAKRVKLSLSKKKKKARMSCIRAEHILLSYNNQDTRELRNNWHDTRENGRNKKAIVHKYNQLIHDSEHKHQEHTPEEEKLVLLEKLELVWRRMKLAYVPHHREKKIN